MSEIIIYTKENWEKDIMMAESRISEEVLATVNMTCNEVVDIVLAKPEHKQMILEEMVLENT